MTDERTLPRIAIDPADKKLVLEDKTYLLVVEGPHAGAIFTLSEGKISMGRDSGAGIVLNDTQSSRLHVEFATSQGESIVRDLGSTNGTFVNGEKISKSKKLEEGDEVLLGQTLLRFTFINPIDGGRLGLAAHGYFENRLSEELDRSIRYKRPLSVLMVAMDADESIKDGEAFLQGYYPKVVAHIRKMIRTMDVLAHYGKYEFEILLPETNKEDGFALAKRIATEKSFDENLFISVGLVNHPDDGRSRDLLIEQSRQALQKAKKKSKEKIEKFNTEVKKVTRSSQEVIVKSEKMKQVFDLVERIAKSNITVLIQGETGVGKEVIAEALHSNSDRSKNAFVCINCAALTETLLESELFGHEKGSFTGAEQTKIGLFESADKGTIFLDEVGEMSLKTQVKLLRVLQSRQIMRVGSSKEIETDVRIIAATNRKLEDEIKKNLFREDLFYRLNAATIAIPPLRERKEEIPSLVESFMYRVCKENDLSVKEFSPEAMEMLIHYQWPGNIRELKNTVERAVVISEGNSIGTDSLSDRIHATSFSYTAPDSGDNTNVASGIHTEVGDMKKVVDAYEKNIITNALIKTDWNQTKAADMLHIPRRTLVSKIKKYKIKKSS